MLWWRGGNRDERGTARSWATLDPDERAEANRARVARRRRSALRTYCVQNALTYLWTLTFADEHLPEDREAAMREGRNFVRRLRRALDVDAIPYVFVVEWGKTTGRIHLHVALGQFVAHALVRDAWGRGHVWVSKKKAPMRVKGGRRMAARAAAHYLSKYIGKELEAPEGKQAYRVAEGFDVRVEFGGGVTLHEAVQVAAEMVGGPLDRTWSSDGVEDWQGPPTAWLQFGDP